MPHKKEGRSPTRKAALPNKHFNNPKSHAVDFQAVNRAALGVLPLILKRWLPDGKRLGSEWVARNPRRADQHAGSFSINMRSGRWADFATGDGGGDLISLAAYLGDLRQIDAACKLAAMLGVSHD